MSSEILETRRCTTIPTTKSTSCGKPRPYGTCVKHLACRKTVLAFVRSLFIKHCGRDYVNSGMSASVHLGKDEGQSQLVIQNVDMGSAESDSKPSRRTLRSDRTGLDRRPVGIVHLLGQVHEQINSQKVHIILTHSVCLGGKCQAHPPAGETWETQKKCFIRLGPRLSSAPRRPGGGGGQSCSSGGFLPRTRLSFSTKCRCCLARIRVIFMSMCNDIDWDQNCNEEVCTHNSASVSSYGKILPRWKI